MAATRCSNAAIPETPKLTTSAETNAQPEAQPELRDVTGRVTKDGEPTETPLEALASICTVIVLALFFFTFVGQNFEIPSASMEDTLLIGDHLLVDRITIAPPTKWAPFVHYRPVQHGDIIVFLKPNAELPDLILVKRVVGVAGDHIHLNKGVVYLNGVAQMEPHALQPREDGDPQHSFNPYRDDFPAIPGSEEPQLTELWRQELPTAIQGGDLVVPAGKVFAMGDNRTESLDGRYWGFVPLENIMGRPMFVYWSFKTPADQEDKTGIGERIGFMFHVLIHVFDGTRWSRTLHIIR